MEIEMKTNKAVSGIWLRVRVGCVEWSRVEMI